jgi:hypothetical protein
VSSHFLVRCTLSVSAVLPTLPAEEQRWASVAAADEEEDGDWELTPHPLPPPPSQPEDVEHWTRAMTAPEAVATPLELVKGWAHMAQRWYQGTQ